MKPPFVKSNTFLSQLDMVDGPGDGGRADRILYKKFSNPRKSLSDLVLLATLGVDDLSLIVKLIYSGHTSDFQDREYGIL
jgi:hypothetical protein